jgi:hypothetical protein
MMLGAEPNPFQFDNYSKSFLKILTKNAELVPLYLNKYQMTLLRHIWDQQSKGLPVRIIILKPRQIGISTFCTANVYHQCATTHYQKGVVIANDMDNTNNLFNMCKRYWEFSPEQIRPMKRRDNSKALVFENGDEKTRKASPGLLSSIHLESANKATAGRSGTIHNLHCSEVAYWANAPTIVTGLFQAVPYQPNTSIFLESTANGMQGVGEEFYKRWLAAESGESDFLPVFFPWHHSPEYSLRTLDFKPTKKERELKNLYNLTDDQLNWRRYKIRNEMGSALLDPETQFKQEYPFTAAEAFIASGRTVFNTEYVMNDLKQAAKKKYKTLEV